MTVTVNVAKWTVLAGFSACKLQDTFLAGRLARPSPCLRQIAAYHMLRVIDVGSWLQGKEEERRRGKG